MTRVDAGQARRRIEPVSIADISMPHRHLVRWEDGPLRADFEVEVLADGIVLYTAEPKLPGGASVPVNAAREVETWLRSRFACVDVDPSPKPAF